MAYGETELFIVKGGPAGAPGIQGKDGASAFESWLAEQGITDTPETHDANWQAFLDAIKGGPGEDGVSGPSVFEDWCIREGKDPADPASWEAFIDSLTAGISGRVGEIIAAMSEDPVQGALLCDGATYSRNDYIMLYTFLEAHVPTLIIDADNFKVPDLRGEFLRGLDNGSGVDPDRVLGSEQGDAARNVEGIIAITVTGPGIDMVGYSSGALYSAQAFMGSRLNLASMISNSDPNLQGWAIGLDTSRVVPTADENRPLNVAVNYYIRYTTVTGNEVEQGPTGPQGDNAFITWCKEHEIDPTDPSAWEDYMTAIKGNKGDDGTPGEQGVDGLSPYEEYKLQHPSASYEDWLRVVTAAFSVPLVDAVVGGPSVKIPKVHPASLKPIYRKRVDMGFMEQYTFSSQGICLIPLTGILDVDISSMEEVYLNTSESYTLASESDILHTKQLLPQLLLNDSSLASGIRGVLAQVSLATSTLNLICSEHYQSGTLKFKLVACIEYTLTADQPIEFPIWTQKEGWISPPGYIGEIVATFDTDPEPGTLVCDGSLLERLDYPSLYDFLQLKIPTLIVDEDTFNLPDLRGEFLRGVDASGQLVGSKQGDAIRNITGQIGIMTSTTNHDNVGYAMVGGAIIENGVSQYGVRANATTITNGDPNIIGNVIRFDASLQVPTANENRPVNTAVTYCIRYMNTFDPSGGGQMPIGSVEVIEDEVTIP